MQDGSLDSSRLGSEQLGVVVARYGAEADVLATPETASKEVYRCTLRANLGSVVTGDQVVWRAGDGNTGIIVATQARQSEFSRPDAHGNLRAIAANIDQVFVVIAPAPLTPAGLIDRYLVALETLDLPATLLLNKADLLDRDGIGGLQHLASLYQSLGYPLLRTSTKSATGLDQLTAALRSHTSVFVGQSGVGKSSLINALLPDVETRVRRNARRRTVWRNWQRDPHHNSRTNVPAARRRPGDRFPGNPGVRPVAYQCATTCRGLR